MDYAEWIFGLLTIVFAIKGLGVLLQRKLRSTLTALDDITYLGLPRKGPKIKGTAVICGGSISGLLSARVCSDHFEKVVIVEPEAWLATEEGLRDRHREAFTHGSHIPKRSRVPQYTSIHLYQAFQCMALRKLFPGFDRQMQRIGARIHSPVAKIHVSGIPMLMPYHEYLESIPTTFWITRPGYETALRKLVLSNCSNVKYIVGSVSGLVPHRTRDDIAAVMIRTHSSNDAMATEVRATLVVDCTGSAQRGLQWLQDAPFQAVYPSGAHEKFLPLSRLRVSYDPKVAYSTCEFNIPPALHQKVKSIFLPVDYENGVDMYTFFSDPQKGSSMVSIQKREGSYVQLMCGGSGYRGKISSVADIRDYISKVITDRPFPKCVHTFLDLLEQEEVPATFVQPRILLIGPPAPRSYVQYSRAVGLPANFIALGDAVLQINPVRGQGCTKACIEAVTLNALLARTNPLSALDEHKCDVLPEDFARTFFSMQAQRTGSLWEVHKRSDYAWNTTVPEAGDDPKSTGAFERWYFAQVLKLTTKDPQVVSDWWHVNQFLAPPTDLLWPRTMMKVVWAYVTQILGL